MYNIFVLFLRCVVNDYYFFRIFIELLWLCIIVSMQVSFQDLYQIEDVVSLEIPFSQTNVTLSGLTDDTSYVVNVTSVMHKRSSVPASSVFTTDLRS